MNRIREWALFAAFGALLLFLFHFESDSIGPIKVSHLWKGALLIPLVISAKFRSSVYNPLFLLAFLAIFSLELFYNPANAFFNFSSAIVIPLIGIFSLSKNANWNRKMLYFFSVFFILCFLPYEIGILTPRTEGLDLSDAFGVNEQGIIGPFQTVHSASTALAGSLLVILYFFITATYNRIWLSILFVIGFYFLFYTYVRTGMAMFLTGSLVMLSFYAMKSSRMFFRVSLIVLGIAPLISTLVLSNDVLMARIMGERKRSSEISSIEDIGSGRGLMAIASIDIYSEASLIEKFIGMGAEEQKSRMKDKIGKSLIPHNGFLGILIHFGMLGFCVYLWFIAKIWKSTGRMSSTQDVIFLRSLLASYLVMTFFQQHDMLYMLALLMFAYAWKRNSVVQFHKRNTMPTIL